MCREWLGKGVSKRPRSRNLDSPGTKAGRQVRKGPRILGFLRNRLPAWNEIVSLSGVLVFVVHSWSVQAFLFNLPSFILKYRSLEVVAIFCYHMVFAFLETLLCAGLLVVLAGVLPSKWLRKGFVYKGFLIVLAAVIGAIFLQNSISYGEFAYAGSKAYLLYEYIGGGLIVFAGLWVLVAKVGRVQRWIVFLVDQISIMLFIYLPLDVIGLAVVAVRLIR